MAGDAGGDAAAAGFGVFGLLVAVGDGEDLFEHAFEFDAFEADGGGFDGEGAGAEGFGFEAVAVELVGDLGEGDHLGGEEVDEERHEEALALDLLGVALAEDFFEEDALVGYVLVDDPEAFFVGGEDEGVAELAEGFEGGEGGEGVGLLGGGFVVCGFGLVVVVADGDGVAGEGEASGGWWDDGSGEVEGGRFDWWGVEGFGVGGCGIGFGLREGVGFEDGLGDGVVAAGEGAYVEQEGAGGAVGAAGEGGGEAGGGAGLHERGADGVADEVVDEAGLAEADFGFGGVDVDVDLLRGHLEEEEDDGEGGGWEDVAVGLGEGVEDELVADEALVDEDVDGVAIEFLQLGFGDEAGEAEVAGFGRSVVGVALPGWWFGEAGAGEVELGGGGEHVVAGVFAEDLEEAVGGVGDGGGDEECLRGGVEFEVFGGVDEGVVGDEGGDVGELGLLGLEEFAAGGGVEEEVADGDGGADGEAGVFDAEDVAAGDLDEGAGGVFGDAGFEGEAGDAGDGGQGFAAEAEGGDGEEVVGGAELGGGVALEGEEGVVRTMPWPLSAMRMSLRPPASTSMRMRVAPASREFSRSSLTTEAGRSTTSPAAIWFATRSERMRMRPMS